MDPAAYPPPVAEGDTVAVVAPSHAAPESGVERGLERLRSFDVEPKVYETARRDTDWLRCHPRERAADVNEAFADDEVTAVVATMGGNVEHTILPLLDRETIRENPKRFLGSSDNTHLHLALNVGGIVSFYGGQLFPDLAADAEMHPYTRRHVERALRATPFGEIEPAGEWTDEYYDEESDDPRTWFPAGGWTWKHAEVAAVSGPVVGGCLSMLETQLMLGEGSGADFGPDLAAGAILAVETSGETPDSGAVERFFSILGELGILDAIEGLVVGRPETPGGERADREAYRKRQREAVVRGVSGYVEDLPMVFDLDFGHAAPVLPLPLGARMEIDGDERRIRFPG